MAEPIKAGDLVMVVHWPHEHLQTLVTGRTFPKVFAVVGIDRFGGVHCPNCGQTFPGPVAYYDNWHAIPVAWLKRIDPEEMPEEVKREEEIAA